jgi:hypothetical protein
MATVPAIGSRVQISSYDWETNQTTYNAPAMTAAQRWQCAISQATEAARKRFPHSHDRIEKAYALVHDGKVVLHPKDKTATVQSSDGTTAYTVNGTCECPDAARAPEHFCKHALAVTILKKATVLVKAFQAATAPVTLTPTPMDTSDEADEADEAEVVEPAVVVEAEVVPYKTPPLTIPAAFVITIQGKQFILFSGLLFLAHQQGLLSLTEEVTHVTDTYVMAQARAEFEDGRVFRGVGDSSPDNVGKQVKAHWRRLAGTRAMARALRNALNIAMCSLEEIE